MPPSPSTKLAIAAQETITVPGGTLLKPSPDGQLIAVIESDKRLCVHRLQPTADLLVCGSLPPPHKTASIDRRSVRWSPDSTRIAFNENAFRELWEPDIWTMDAATGTVVDVTDDGQTTTVLKATAGANFDVVPAWSPDGQSIVFARTPQGVPRTDLVVISATGDMRATISSVIDRPVSVYYGTRWLGGVARIVYAVVPGDLHGAGIGIFSIEGGTASPQPRKLVGADDRKGPPIIADIADDGHVMVLEYENVRATLSSSGSAYALLWPDSGRLESIDPPGPAVAGKFVVGAALSPDATMLAYAYRVDGRFQLAVRDLANGSEQLLGEPQEPPFAQVDDATAIAWLAPTELWVGRAHDSGTLYTLTTGTP